MKFENKLSKNLETVIHAIVVFAEESLDVSARGLLRALERGDDFSPEELLALLGPRDYDVGLSEVQRTRMRDRFHEVLNAR